MEAAVPLIATGEQTKEKDECPGPSAAAKHREEPGDLWLHLAWVTYTVLF